MRVNDSLGGDDVAVLVAQVVQVLVSGSRCQASDVQVSLAQALSSLVVRITSLKNNAPSSTQGIKDAFDDNW